MAFKSIKLTDKTYVTNNDRRFCVLDRIIRRFKTKNRQRKREGGGGTMDCLLVCLATLGTSIEF